MPGKTLIDGLFFPESPRWKACEQNWYFSDILNQRIHRMDSSGQINPTIETPDLVSGLGWLPNDDLIAETFGYALIQWDIAEDRTLHHRRPFSYLGAAPDGICLDADGCLWIACPYFQYGDSGGFIRIAQGGMVKKIIAITDPQKSAYACPLGGPDGQDLLLCESTIFGKPRHVGDGQIRLTRVEVPSAYY